MKEEISGSGQGLTPAQQVVPPHWVKIETNNESLYKVEIRCQECKHLNTLEYAVPWSNEVAPMYPDKCPNCLKDYSFSKTNSSMSQEDLSLS